MIRPLTFDDVAKIPRLLASEAGQGTEPSEYVRDVVENLLPKLFLQTPHADPAMPGLVSEDQGELTGMIGRITRRVEFRGRPIRAAVACELFVDPAHRAKMLGVKLLKQVMSGPQDLLFSDIANDTSRKIWTGLGGSVASWYGLTWLKILQPATFALSTLDGGRLATVTTFARPLAKLADRFVQRRKASHLQLGPKPKASSQPLTPEMFLELFPRFSAADELRPLYDRETIDWIWPRLDFMYLAGPSEQQLVLSPSGEPLGWYVFQMTDAGLVRVSQIVALGNTIGIVLDHLLHRAAERGAVAVSGRVIPRFLQAFADRNCIIRRRSAHTLIHSPHAEILDAFACGRAFLSLFESEGPLQIWVNSSLALKRCQDEKLAASRNDSSLITFEPKPPDILERQAATLDR